MRTMKVLFMMLAATLFTLGANAQKNADDILGKWLNEDEDAHIEITKKDNMYYGKLVWLLNPTEDDTGLAKVDDDNPDPALQSRPILGLEILTDFVFDGKNEWEDGKIYDPKSGKTYSCYIKFVDEGKIKIRGFIGITLLGRTSYWTSVKEK